MESSVDLSKYRFNKYQTQVTDELVSQMSPEMVSMLFDIIDSNIFIRNLSSAERRTLEEMPKDDEGKVIVDFANPHILKDMDFFRQRAIYFQKYGTYTKLVPSSNPNSEYRKFWKEEARRCREGLVRSDGEWIPPDYYFYLNYAPILQNIIVPGTRRMKRVRDFPLVYDGDYLFFHYFHRARQLGRHINVLKKRGSGFSYKTAASTSRVFILGESEEESTDMKVFFFAIDTEYLIKDGVLNKFIDITDWCADTTPWPHIRDLKDSLASMQWKMGYKDKDSSTARGVKNEVIGVTLKGDPERGRGKRGSRIYWEEAGTNKNLLRSWNIARASVEEDGYAYGNMISFGTGGSDVEDFLGMQELFYNPEGYNILGLPNVYDRNSNPDKKSSFFFGDYLNRKGRFDKDGNSDVIGALIDYLGEYLKIKYNSTDPNTIIQFMAEHPIYPQDAIMRREGSVFPVVDIKDYLAEITMDYQHFVSAHYVGDLAFTGDGGVKFKLDLNKEPIREFPLENKSLAHGAIEIFEHPARDSEGKVFRDRYIGGVDPIDYDAEYDNNSLGSVFIFDLWTDRIVAEYTGRPRFADQFYEVCLKLAMYYNAVLNYESNLKGLFPYFNNRNALSYLCEVPSILLDKELIRGNLYGNRSFGTRTNNHINALARKWQADWLMSPAYNPVLDVDTEGGEEKKEIVQLNLHKVRSIAYLRELIAWRPDLNTDRISAMNMVMILRKERFKYIDTVRENKRREIYEDPWFKRFGPKRYGLKNGVIAFFEGKDGKVL